MESNRELHWGCCGYSTSFLGQQSASYIARRLSNQLRICTSEHLGHPAWNPIIQVSSCTWWGNLDWVADCRARVMQTIEVGVCAQLLLRLPVEDHGFSSLSDRSGYLGASCGFMKTGVLFRFAMAGPNLWSNLECKYRSDKRRKHDWMVQSYTSEDNSSTSM